MRRFYRFIDSREELQSVGTGLEDETEIEATCRAHPYSGGTIGWFLRMVNRFRKRLLLKAGVKSRQRYELHSARIIVNGFVIARYRPHVNPSGSATAALVSLTYPSL
jgi:hypothetical protein